MTFAENFFFKLHRGLPREGPGDDQSTAQAFRLISGLPPEPLILDVGCGPGAQTLLLVRLCRGFVAALDNHRPFLDELRARAAAQDIDRRIFPIQGTMTALPFPAGTFDLIWSEGAIYITGFENGLKMWRPLVKAGGAIAVSEISWLAKDPPRELREFWQSGYPAMKAIPENLAVIRACGFELLGHFTLPEEAWWDSYYGPLEKRITLLRKKYSGRAEAQAILDLETAEISLYRQYARFYGYVFYVMRVPRSARSSAPSPA